MARVVATNLQLQGNQILGLRVEVLASDPTGGDLYEGRLWFNSTSNLLKYYDGGATVELGAASGGGVQTLGVTSPLQNTGTAGDPVVALKTGGGAGSANGIVNVHIASDAAIALSKLATDPLARGNHTGTQTAATISDLATVVKAYRLDEFAVPTADLNLNSRKITSLADPGNPNDAANKSYVDGLVNGLAWKESVRAATTAAGTLASSFENGDVIDGVTLATNDRILIKNQAAGAENGIYTVNASGAPTRATDADSQGDLQGATVFVDEGTANGNTTWTQTVAGAITVNTTALTFAQAAGPGATEAGTGLTRTGSTIALTTPVAVANGGTNATDAAGARTSLGATGKYAVDVGGATSVVVTHNLNTRDVVVMVRATADPWAEVIADVEMTTVNTVTVRFATAPAANAYRVIVVG